MTRPWVRVPRRRHAGRHRRWRHALGLVPVLLALLVVPASPARGAGVNVFPSDPLLDGFTRFSITGVAFRLLDVRFNGTVVGQVVGDPDSGFFGDSFTVPPAGSPGAPVCGTNTITLTELRTGVVADSGTLVAHCPRLRVTPTETSGVRAVAYTVTPVDFPPLYFPRQLTVDGAITAFQATNGGDVVFTASLTCGTHRVQLLEEEGGTHDGPPPQASVDAPLVVRCPAATLNPAAVRSADQPTTVTTTATGYHPGQPVAVTIDGTPRTTGTTDSGGRLTAALPVTGLACGPHQVAVTEQPPAPQGTTLLLTAGATLTITGCTPPPPGAPSITLDPTVIRTGMLTHVTGTGFTPSQPVTLTWAMPDGSPLPGDCTTTADPTGHLDTYCLVLPHGILGARQLTAAQGTRTARADAVVDGGTMQPGTRGDQLVFRR